MHLKGSCPKLSKMYPFSQVKDGSDEWFTDGVGQTGSSAQSVVKELANRLVVSSSLENTQVSIKSL